MTDPLVSAAEAMAIGGARLDGAEIGFAWSLPFIGLLLSIAVVPLLAPYFWERQFGKVAALWTFALLLPCAVVFGLRTTAAQVLHTFLLDYLPFIILLFTLFVVAGGIRASGNLVGTPATNSALLTFGTLCASLLGTTGASMVLIRPVIRANQDRHFNVHVFLFFIFLVANIGGSLTPLGDPPLFLGFLKGIDFLWTLEHMLCPMLFVSSVLLALFYLIDRLAWNREAPEVRAKSAATREISIEGLHNVLYLFAVALTVLASGIWKGNAAVPIGLGIELPASGLLRDATLILNKPPLLAHDEIFDSRGECVHLDADAGGCDVIRRHLRHHDPGAGHAEGRPRRAIRPFARPGFHRR